MVTEDQQPMTATGPESRHPECCSPGAGAAGPPPAPGGTRGASHGSSDATPAEAARHRRDLWLDVVAAAIEVKLLDELGDLDAARAGVERVLSALAVAEVALPAPVVKPPPSLRPPSSAVEEWKAE